MDIKKVISSLKSMEDFDENLIQLVKDNEILYNKRCSGYKNIILKTRKWQEIAEALGSTSEESIRRWKSLRDRFTRELKKENLPSGSGAKNHPTWDLLTNLDFLRDHVAPRSTSGNMNPEVVSERPETEEETMEEATGQLEFEETCESPSYSSSGLSTPSTSGTQKKKKTRLEEVNRAFTEGVASFQEFVKSKITPPPVQTSGEKFAQLVANMFDNLTERHQKQARVEIMKYLVSLEEDELNKLN